MGLMQLLTVGRSLSEARDRPHRFKVLSGAMPTFGHPTMKGGEQPWGAVDSEDEIREDKTDSGEQAMKVEIAQAVGTEAKNAMNAYPLGRWTLKVNPFKSSSRPSSQPVVQGELSLDKVKVIRNDLSDSDLELVAANKRRAPLEQNGNVFAATTAEAAVKAVKPSWWKRLSSRWFGAKAR